MSGVVVRRRLSVVRLLVAVVVTGVVVVGVCCGVGWVAASVVVTRAGWFAGYVDVTSTPTFAFESPLSAADKNVVLSFIVSTPGEACQPSWGGAYSLGEASTALDLDRRIARLQQQGGDVAVSFGGQKNDELATDCMSVSGLAAAYSAVIDRYRLSTIDVDVEGANLTDGAASLRRAEALALVQKQRRAAGKNLAIWFTLPVAPTGLEESGQAVVRETLAKKVDIAGVNAMTMDFGASLTAGTSELTASTQALTAVQRQLGVLYSRAGISLSAKTLWGKVGVTPMIGQNDVPSEVFSLADASGLNVFARSHGLGRVSMWSLNRDITCGSNYVALKVVSDSCSGVSQGSATFAGKLSASITGRPRFSAPTITSSEPVDVSQQKDDPATSPYPIWNESYGYPEGTKIVWHRNVYEAKWWTRGDVPDNPVVNAWQSPWSLVGPVLAGEKPVVVPVVPVGTYPEWSDAGQYVTGQRVVLGGVAFQARWWNQAESPAAALASPESSPWVALTTAQINAVIAAANK